jgi:hypothetical protein
MLNFAAEFVTDLNALQENYAWQAGCCPMTDKTLSQAEAIAAQACQEAREKGAPARFGDKPLEY